MKIDTLLREFRYNGVVLADPNQTFSLPQVRDFYATVYPEIVSADIDGPEQLGAKQVYTFRRAVGTKGAVTYFFLSGAADFLGADLGNRRFAVVEAAPDRRNVHIDELANLLPSNIFNAEQSSLIKSAQMLIHAGRAHEVSPQEIAQLKLMWSNVPRGTVA